MPMHGGRGVHVALASPYNLLHMPGPRSGRRRNSLAPGQVSNALLAAYDRAVVLIVSYNGMEDETGAIATEAERMAGLDGWRHVVGND